MRGRRAGDGADPASELGFGRFGHLGSPRNRASPSLPCDSVNRTARNGSVGGREPAAGSLLGSWAAALRCAGLGFLVREPVRTSSNKYRCGFMSHRSQD